LRRERCGALDIRRCETGGTVLGLLPGVAYEEGEEPVLAGDLILLYSDGVVEATDRSGAEFGEERIVQLLRTHAADSAEEVRDRLLDALRQFAADQTFADDVTIVVVRVRE
jgi:sigma-B regulation protein RsbU (phosphoserine phosphatase)